MATRILLRRDSSADWEGTDPVLADGEPGYDKTTGELRIGDGVSSWSELTPVGGSIPEGAVEAALADYFEAHPPTGLEAHIASETPHPAYDEDLVDLTVVLENHLI